MDKQNEVLITQTDAGTYKSIITNVKGNKWRITQFTGKNSFVSVSKITNNPFRNLFGKEFKDFDSACQSYKSGDMKIALLLAETTFKNS